MLYPLAVSVIIYVCVSCDGLETGSGCIPAGTDSNTLTTLISTNIMVADAKHIRFTVATDSICLRQLQDGLK